jgi:hypothetical protein
LLKRKKNTSGDTKTTVFKWIAQVILPELFAVDGTTVANCLKGQLERYVSISYLPCYNIINLLAKAHKNIPEASCSTSTDWGWS